MTVAADVRRLVLVMAIAIVAATLTVALVTAIGFRADARRVLQFDFAGIARSPREVGSIWLHNARLLVAPLAAAVAVSGPWIATADHRQAVTGWAWRLARLLCDVVLLGAVASNLVVVGAGLGAYDLRMLRAIAPHGVFELAAFSMALSVYLQARRGPLAPRAALTLVAAAVIALALGALVEVYVTL